MNRRERAEAIMSNTGTIVRFFNSIREPKIIVHTKDPDSWIEIAPCFTDEEKKELRKQVKIKLAKSIKLEPLKRGFTKKGGINLPPSTPRPKVSPKPAAPKARITKLLDM